MSKNLDLAREFGANISCEHRHAGDPIISFDSLGLDAFAERIRAEHKADAPEPSGERAALIKRLREDAIDHHEVAYDQDCNPKHTANYQHYLNCCAAADMLAADAPEQEPIAFEVAWDSIDWDVWRMKPIKELMQHIHSLTAPQARELIAVRKAIEDYYLSLDRREHGGIAQDRAFNKIEQALGMSWVRGAVLAARSEP